MIKQFSPIEKKTISGCCPNLGRECFKPTTLELYGIEVPDWINGKKDSYEMTYLVFIDTYNKKREELHHRLVEWLN